MKKRIIRNRCKRKLCAVFGINTHDLPHVTVKTSTDGELEYVRRPEKRLDLIENLTKYKETLNINSNVIDFVYNGNNNVIV